MGNPRGPAGVPNPGAFIACAPLSGWAGPGGDGCSGRGRGSLLCRKRRAGEPQPVSQVGARDPLAGAGHNHKSWEQSPCWPGCAEERSPARAARAGHGHRRHPATAVPGSSPRCGGPHSLSGLRTAQPSVLQHSSAACKKTQPNKKPATKAGALSLFPAALPRAAPTAAKRGKPEIRLVPPG